MQNLVPNGTVYECVSYKSNFNACNEIHSNYDDVSMLNTSHVPDRGIIMLLEGAGMKIKAGPL